MARTFGLFVVAALIAGIVPGCAVERVVSGRRDYRVDPTITYKLINLEDLIQHASSFKGWDIELVGMFHRRDESVWEHFHTPFTQDDYTSFSVWTLNTRVWEDSARPTSMPTFYMHNNNPHMQTLVDAQMYCYVRVQGAVRSDFEGRAWVLVNTIEVERAPIFSAESFASLVGGMNDKSQNRPASAIFKLQDAVKGPLSDEARYQAHLALGELYEQRYDFSMAIQNFQNALSVRSDDYAAKEGVKRNEEFLKRQKMKENLKEPEEKKSGS